MKNILVDEYFKRIIIGIEKYFSWNIKIYNINIKNFRRII